MNRWWRASTWLQRRIFVRRLVGYRSSDTMPLCARVWLEGPDGAEWILNKLLGEDHCFNTWIQWLEQWEE